MYLLEFIRNQFSVHPNINSKKFELPVHRRNMTLPTQESNSDSASLASTRNEEPTLPKMCSANYDLSETLMKEPIGNLNIPVSTNHIDTFGHMKYLLSETDNTPDRRGNGTASGLPYEDVAEIVPTINIRPADVLVGQGQTLWMRLHPGNALFRKLVADSFGRYNSASTRRAEKTKLSESIVLSIYRENGRFLKPHEFECGKVTLWKRLDDVEERRKVASSFRGIRKQQKRNRE